VDYNHTVQQKVEMDATEQVGVLAICMLTLTQIMVSYPLIPISEEGQWSMEKCEVLHFGSI